MAVRIRLASRCAAALALAFAGASANAYVDAPTLLPGPLKAGEMVSVDIRAGYCDGFFGDAGSGAVTRSGNDIRLLLDSSHGSDAFCLFPPEVHYTFDIGVLPAGNFTLTVDRRYDVIAGPAVVETLGIFSLSVAREYTPTTALTTSSRPAMR